MTKQLRAVVGARVSVVQGPQKVSHIAQREAGMKWVAEHGHTVVGTIQDLGVSASINPFERPDLGPWLTEEKSHEWDALVFSKLDRLFRSTRDCVKFAEWAEQHAKMLVFAEDSLTLNYRVDRDRTSLDGMMAELFVYLGSFFAQLELNRFKSRALDGHRVLRQTDRWAAGVPPLGFKVADHPSGKGKGLERDTDGYRLLHGMADKLLDGWSFTRIAAWLNETGAQTNKARAGDKAAMWSIATVMDALTSPRTQGLKMHRGQTVLDGDGSPIVMAKPTFDAAKWQRIQDAAALRRQSQRVPTQTVNPMLGVGFCGCTGCHRCAEALRRSGSEVCGRALAQHFRPKSNGAGATRSYRCGRKCSRVFLPAETGDELLEQTFLDRWGDTKVTRRVFVPGEDHSHELEDVEAIIARLRRESDAGLLTTPDDERIWLERLKTQTALRDELAAKPARAAGWAVVETDQTYREVWASEDRRQLLVDKGVRFVLHPSPRGKALRFDLYDPRDGAPLPMRGFGTP